MGEFKSGLFTQYGRLLLSPWTESHDDLISIFGLRDDKPAECALFVRLEYKPTDNTYTTFALRVDERVTPAWFTDGKREQAERDFASYIKRITITEDQKLLYGGQFLLLDGVIDKVMWANIEAMTGSARVGSMYDSAQVGSMRGSARVGSMYDSAQVGSMRGSARVGSMYNSAQVGSMRGSARVGSMRGSARVGSMTDFARVGSMYDSARVGSMYGSAQVGSMYGSARVGSMTDSARVIHDYRMKK